MSWYRIFSTMIDDGEHQGDKKATIVLHAKINDDNRINNKIQTFGYSQDWDEETGTYLKYPFILQFNSKEKITGKIDYGGWDSEADDRLNIFNKKIKVNETFTFFEQSEGKMFEYIYRIERVVPI